MGVARKRTVSPEGEVTYSDPITIVDRSIDSNKSLGNTAKSVDSSYQERRAGRYKLLGTAARLLPGQRVASCMRCCGAGGVAVRYSPSGGFAGYSGLATCGSVWACPVCSSRISNGRRDELNSLLAWARKMGYQPVLLTLTARHGIENTLSELLDGMKRAKKRFHQSRGWRAVDPLVVGHVTATEVTHGVNGWHVHFHMIIIADCGSQEEAEDRFDLVDEWLAALRPPKKRKSAPVVDLAPAVLDMSGNGHAFRVQGAGAAGDYVTKWGAGEEMTLSGSKFAKLGKGANPWQLLAAADGGDNQAAALFVEYANQFHGKRQLVWSRGLKRLLGIVEKSDEELAASPECEDMEDIYIVEKIDWQLVVRRRLQAELLTVAETGGAVYIDIWLEALRLQHKLDPTL